MRILVNGESREFSPPLSLRQLLNDLELSHGRVAIELNQNVVRRAAWDVTTLNDGDRVEIVHFVGGG